MAKISFSRCLPGFPQKFSRHEMARLPNKHFMNFIVRHLLWIFPDSSKTFSRAAESICGIISSKVSEELQNQSFSIINDKESAFSNAIVFKLYEKGEFDHFVQVRADGHVMFAFSSLHDAAICHQMLGEIIDNLKKFGIKAENITIFVPVTSAENREIYLTQISLRDIRIAELVRSSFFGTEMELCEDVHEINATTFEFYLHNANLVKYDNEIFSTQFRISGNELQVFATNPKEALGMFEKMEKMQASLVKIGSNISFKVMANRENGRLIEISQDEAMYLDAVMGKILKFSNGELQITYPLRLAYRFGCVLSAGNPPKELENSLAISFFNDFPGDPIYVNIDTRGRVLTVISNYTTVIREIKGKAVNLFSDLLENYEFRFFTNIGKKSEECVIGVPIE